MLGRWLKYTKKYNMEISLKEKLLVEDMFGAA